MDVATLQRFAWQVFLPRLIHHRLRQCEQHHYVPLQVGAATETELEDRKLRIEDAKNATFAAVEEGIVPGGGAVFLHLSELVSDFKTTLPLGEEQMGAEIVFKSLSVSSYQHQSFITCNLPFIGRQLPSGIWQLCLLKLRDLQQANLQQAAVHFAQCRPAKAPCSSVLSCAVASW